MPKWNRTRESLFWEKVDRRGDTECWEWRGASNRGYGYLYTGWAERADGTRHDRFTQAHRFSYELMVGPIPPGLVIDHLCLNKGCVNPAHLEPVTIAENTTRGAVSRTHCRRGHPFALHTMYDRTGYRRCRVCRNASKRRNYHARQARELHPYYEPIHCERLVAA